MLLVIKSLRPLTGIVIFNYYYDSFKLDPAHDSFRPLTGIVIFNTYGSEKRIAEITKRRFRPLTGIVIFKSFNETFRYTIKVSVPLRGL